MRSFATGVVALMLVARVAGCGGGGPGPVDLTGKSPQEGATLAANAICNHQAACGKPRVTCTGDQTGMHCTGEIAPVDRARCFTDAQGDFQELLSCPALTSAQRDMLEICVNAWAADPCATQAEADERARLSEMGTSPPDSHPPECDILSEAFPGC